MRKLSFRKFRIVDMVNEGLGFEFGYKFCEGRYYSYFVYLVFRCFERVFFI